MGSYKGSMNGIIRAPLRVALRVPIPGGGGGGGQLPKP